MKVLVIGTKDFTLGFYAAGLDVIVVDNEKEFNLKLQEQLDKEYGLIICDDRFSIEQKVYKKYLSKQFPILVYLKDVSNINEEIKKSLGIEVLK